MPRNLFLLTFSVLLLLTISARVSAQVATDVDCTGCVDTQDIAAAAVTTGKIANGAVNNNKLAADAVGSAKIKDGAVTADKLGDGSVSTDALKSRAVTTDKIKDGAVGVKKLSNTAREHVTLLEYRDTATLVGVTGGYQELREIGTFEKLFNSSTVQLDWLDHARWQDLDDSGEGFCDFQLRVDGIGMPSDVDSGGIGRVVLFDGGGTRNDSPISASVFYPALTTGIHSITVWVRGFGDTCTLNFGNFVRHVLVRERTEVIEMPNPVLASQSLYGDQVNQTEVNGVPIH